jgi:hypothetical protein
VHIGVSPNGSSTQYRMLLCTHTHVTDDVPYYDCTRTLLMHAQDTYMFIVDRCWIHSISPPTGGKKKTTQRGRTTRRGEQTTNKNQGEEHKRKKRNKNKKREQTRRTRTREEDEGDVIWGLLLCTYPKKENSAGRWVPCLLSMLLCM